MTKLTPLTWCQIRGLRFNRKPLLNPLNNPIHFNILAISKHSRSRAPHTPGYAAPEQVEDECHLGPLTDLYAVGALMWRVVTGSAPPRVEARLSALRSGRVDPLVIDADTGGGCFSAGLLAVMRECLHLDEAQRPQSAEALLALLAGEEAEPFPPNPPPPRPDEDEGKGKNKDEPPPLVTEAAFAVFALGLGLWFSSQPWSSSSPAKESAPPRPVSERAVGEAFRDALKDGA